MAASDREATLGCAVLSLFALYATGVFRTPAPGSGWAVVEAWSLLRALHHVWLEVRTARAARDGRLNGEPGAGRWRHKLCCQPRQVGPMCSAWCRRRRSFAARGNTVHATTEALLSAELVASTVCRFTVPLVLLALAGCEGSPGGSAGDASPIQVHAADLHVLATSDSIADVEDLAVLPNGIVWVQNSVEPFFIGYGPQGDVLGAHGHAGGGPDEFGKPSGFVVGGLDGAAWVFDRRRHALIRISSPGDARAEVPLPRDAIPPVSVLTGMSLLGSTVRTARLGNDVILPRRSGTGEFAATSFWTTIWNADFVALDPETDSVRTVLSLPEVMGDLTLHFDALSSGFPPFPLWYRLWAVCGGEIRLYDFVRDQLRGFTNAGIELDPISIPPPFTEATPRQFARAGFDIAAAERAGAVTPGVGEMSAADSAQILNGLIERLQGTPEQLGGLLPKYVDFRCADDGTVWLRPLDLERGGMNGGPAWLRITPDGENRKVRFPERFDPYRFTSRRVWGVLRDELEVASVAWTDATAER